MSLPVGMVRELLRNLRVLVFGVLVVFAGATGPAGAGPFDGTIYGVLSNSDQAKLLDMVKNELLAVQAGRSAQAAKDAKASKTFAQLLDEVYHPTKKTAWQKYSKKYAGMAYSAVTKDPAKFARMAGAASAGDYMDLQAELPRIGAVVFGELVSGALDDKNLPQAKYVWDNIVKRAGNLQEVGVLFMNGDVDKAYALAKAQVLKELEDFTENSVAAAIDWVFSEAGISPGKLYVEVIKAEVAFIKWSETFIANDFARHCIKSYLSEYKNTGSTELALQHYERCAALGVGATAERVFARLLKQAELDPRTEVLPMLEAYRKQEIFNPHNFYLDLYRERMAQQEAALAAELAVAQADLAAAAKTFSTVLGNRVETLALELMSEEDRQTLTDAAKKAIADSEKQIKAIRDASKLTLTLCEEFQTSKGPFAQAQADMKRYSSLGYSIGAGIASIPDCMSEGSYLLDDLMNARVLKDVIEGAATDAMSARDQACAAKDNAASAVDKSEARQFVQDAHAATRLVATAVDTGTKAHADFLPHLEEAKTYSSTSLMNMNPDWTRKRLAEIEVEMESLREADLKGIEAQFAEAYNRMNVVQRRTRTLVLNAESSLKQVRVALAPHRTGPMGAQVKSLLASLKKDLQSAQVCEYRTRDEWHGVEGLQSRNDSWKRRKIDSTPDVTALEASLRKKKLACMELLDETANSERPDQEILRISSDTEVALSYLKRAKTEADVCFALAAVTFSSQWSDQPEEGQAGLPQPTVPQSDPANMVVMPKVVGLAGDKATGLVLAVGLGVRVETRGAADTPDKTPGFVHDATVASGDPVQKNTVVTLYTYDKRPVVEVPALGIVTLAEAKRQLTAAGLTFAGIALGEPAPSNAETGKVYTSNPAHPAMLAMLSPVTLVIHGPPKVTLLSMPNVANKSVAEAARILAAYGQHFVAGPLALGPDRPDNVNTGDVHFTDPPAGQLVPAGTVVMFYVYPPQEEPEESLVEIPREIIGMPAGPASTLVRGWDNLLVVPDPIEAGEAQDGDTPGTVQYSVPAVGTLVQKGSTVQLYVFKEAAPQEVSMQACPETNPDTSSYKHRIDSNNNPDDRTYLDCHYFKDGNLGLQKPYTDGEIDGISFQYFENTKCGKYLTWKSIVENGKRLKYWNYSCNSATGSAYHMRTTTYASGKISREVQWRANGALDHDTTYDPPGRIKRTLYYDKNGKLVDCRDRNATGTAIPCD